MDPIVYRWDDGNAPVARGERRSLCDILYACLVTGYGTKPAAGWTREWVNATFDKAVFRPGAGTRFYLKVDGATTGLAYNHNLQGYEAMTGVDDGLFPFNASVQGFQTSTTATATARPWVLIADDRAFFLLCWPTLTSAPGNSNQNASAMFFGDVLSRYAVDSYACGLVGQAGQFGSYGTLLGPDSTSSTLGVSLAMPRKASGVAGSILASLVRGGGPGALNNPGFEGMAYSAGDQIFITRPHLNEAAAYTFRGWLPGFYYPCQIRPFNQLETVTINSKTYLAVIQSFGASGQLGCGLYSLDDWRA